MAKVMSPYKLSGSIGGLTYYENEYGPQVKEKGGPTKWQVYHLDSMTNTRRNAAEWKRATAASQLMRHALISLLPSVKNIRLNSRMNGPMLAAIKADPVHDWGERVITSGDLSVLSGFEFNHKLSLEDVLPLNVENCYSMGAGKVTMDIPAFRLRRKKAIPAEATYYRLVSCVLTIDFEKRTYKQDKQVGELQAMGRKAGEAFCLDQVVQPANEQGCFWLMGIEFYKMVNDKPRLVRGGALRIMQWVGKTYSEEIVGLEGEDVAKGASVVNVKCDASAEPIVLKAAVPVKATVDLTDVTAAVVPVEPVVEDADEVMDNNDEEFEKSLRVLLPVGGVQKIRQEYPAQRPHECHDADGRRDCKNQKVG